jgi:pilus assembly protein Flp/PilA
MTSFGFPRSVTARRLGRFLTDQRGATAIEYGLIAALISVAIIVVVFSIGQGIKNTLYMAVGNALATM